jgi:cytochrome b6-f complex iron-sulfur subunit
MSNISRRDFLKITTNALLTISGFIGLGALLRFLDYQTEPPPKTEFDIGPAADFPIGSHVLADIPAILFHNANGFTALSLVCTHLGCTVEQKDNGFACPCHGSLYDDKGNVLRGPAENSLRMLQVETTSSGHLIIHTGR